MSDDYAKRLREGKITMLSHEVIQKCPHVIFLPSHYRADGTCRCDDPTCMEMAEWGYTWDTKLSRWVGYEQEEE